jgi:hypothetical protein
VFPGETLIIHFENGLTGLTIRDYFSPQYTPKDQSVPIYPEQLTSSPINLHTHGAHISPRGNADNVLLHIPPGMSNTYTYDIPRNMPQGLYWYHSHLHGLTSAQVYAGLVGLLAIGRTDGNLPLVTEKSIPVRNMALQYNFVFDRAGGLDGGQSAGQRCCGRGRERSQIRAHQAERSINEAASRTSGTSVVRKRVAACHPRRRLALRHFLLGASRRAA